MYLFQALTIYPSEICGADAEERSIVLGIMNSMGYMVSLMDPVVYVRPMVRTALLNSSQVNAWLPLLTFPTVDAPTFHKGFIFSSVMYAAQFGITGVVFLMQRRELRRQQARVSL